MLPVILLVMSACVYSSPSSSFESSSEFGVLYHSNGLANPSVLNLRKKFPPSDNGSPLGLMNLVGYTYQNEFGEKIPKMSATIKTDLLEPFSSYLSCLSCQVYHCLEVLTLLCLCTLDFSRKFLCPFNKF
jgi:hypothetical protein